MVASMASQVSPDLANLKGTYPGLDAVLAAVASGAFEQETVSRLWISEGIPFAFKECPAFYDAARRWLADGLDVDPKQICLRGSGRLGYSLAPIECKLGQRYRPGCSDLDFFAVSSRLFEDMKADFERWRDDYSHGAVEPKQGEKDYWKGNVKQLPKNLNAGFVDSNKVPNLKPYRCIQRMNDCLAGLHRELRNTHGAPDPGDKITLRCYRDWAAYVRQQRINLQQATEVRCAADSDR